MCACQPVSEKFRCGLISARNQTRAVRPVKFTAGKFLRELFCCAFSEVRKLYDSDGKLMPVMEFDDGTAVIVRNCDVAVRRE